MKPCLLTDEDDPTGTARAMKDAWRVTEKVTLAERREDGSTREGVDPALFETGQHAFGLQR